jgi:gamma-glutamyltranspeptidase/glutathione hydrolase
MVSLIQSNYRGMGSGMVPPKLGFMLQDRGVFRFIRRQSKFICSSKKTISYHNSGFIPSKTPFMSFMGDFQPQGHVQVLNPIDFGMNLQEAGDAPVLSIHRLYW